MMVPVGTPIDLTNCDREPIHLLGAVQPFGFLLGVSRASWVVTHASENVATWLGVQADALMGLSIDRIFIPEAVHAIRGHLQSAIMSDTVARAFALVLAADGRRFDIAVHVVADTVIIECEPSVDEEGVNAGAAVRGMMARLQQSGDQRVFYRVAAREMRALTGFDRVMIYRFDHDGSGEVIAEAARAGLESYLGLHYPASDIPKQARLLYERNWLRIIPDIDAAPSRIASAAADAAQPLDLSMSVLRSVSPIHIEYLRNMGVGASMSVSILRQNRLWGLFACHHYAAHPVAFGRRTAAELFGQMFSLLMENREREVEGAYETRAQGLHQRLVTVMAAEATQLESIIAHLDDIADLLTCDGIGVRVNGKAALRGLTPSAEDFATLVEWLNARNLSEVYGAYEIAAEHPAATTFADRAAGMLVVPLSRPPRDYLVFFRKEVARSVSWAGDPSKPVTVGPLGERLTPRKSFELWKETVRGQSLPWTPVEIRIAEALRVSLLEVILRLTDLTEVERQRAQQRQELLIAELNHRVRNILALIRGVIAQSRDSADSVESFTRIVGGRIQALARAHDQITADNWGPASFRMLVTAEAGAYLGGKADRVLVRGPEILVEPEAFTTIALVIHELITNSAKYGALSDSRGAVDIDVEMGVAGLLQLRWSERGGPPVKAPTRRGFGSTVIERSIIHDLKGDAKVDFALAGLRAEFTIPARFIRLPAVTPGGEAQIPAESETTGAVPRDVLLVEDNLIIALDTEDILRRLGVRDVRTASSVGEALRHIAERGPDFALLDVNLGSETSFEIATRLQELQVPFAFATGYGEQAAFPDAFAAERKLRKPYTIEVLRDAILGA
jgi:light-regulated signal transduction histidine kinase (bacteriophytochrome)/CheY-like chemotaxis protein